MQQLVQQVDVYRLYNKVSQKHLYTASRNEYNVLPQKSSDWIREGVNYKEYNSPQTGTKAVNGVYNPRSGEHIYTSDPYEVKVVTSRNGWRSEGVAFYAPTKSAKPVYRLFNPAAGLGAHFVTGDGYEKNSLASRGWKYEGVAWYAISTPPKPSVNHTINNTASAYSIQANVVTTGSGQGFHSKIELVTAKGGVKFGVQYDARAAAPYTGKPAFLMENIVSPSAEAGNKYTHTGSAKVGTAYRLLIALQSNGSGKVYVNGDEVGSFSNPKLAGTQVYTRVQTVEKQNGDKAKGSFTNTLVKGTSGVVTNGQTSAVYPDGFKTNTSVGKVTNPITISGTVSGLSGNWSTATPKGVTVQFY